MLPKDRGQKQAKTTQYYDQFSKVYDLLSPKRYYNKARVQAVEALWLSEGKSVLNVPVGTGQNFEYFQAYLNDTGSILGVDISKGMLARAERKINNNHWQNISLIQCDGLLLRNVIENTNNSPRFDAILCDLGLSGFPNWERMIDDLIWLLKQGGRIAVMDWYLPKPSLKGEFVKWIGKGEVDRPIWQYLETKVSEFSVDSSFNRGAVFVASGTKPESY